MLPRRAPVPVFAEVDPATAVITVWFNQHLRSGTSNFNNWSGRTYAAPFDHLFARAVAPAVVFGPTVTFTPQLGAISGGPLTVSYTPPPRDLVGQCSLVPVQPFVDFPMSGPPSYPQFVSGSWAPLIKTWFLTFSEPITVEPPVFDPRAWRCKQGPLTKLAQAVTIPAGLVALWSPFFNGLEDTVIYTGGPPDWTDAEGDPILAFTHAIP